MVTEETTLGPKRARRARQLAGALLRAAACALLVGLALIACEQDREPSKQKSLVLKEPKRLQAAGEYQASLALLNAEVLAHPKNAAALYLLGLAHYELSKNKP